MFMSAKPYRNLKRSWLLNKSRLNPSVYFLGLVETFISYPASTNLSPGGCPLFSFFRPGPSDLHFSSYLTTQILQNPAQVWPVLENFPQILQLTFFFLHMLYHKFELLNFTWEAGEKKNNNKAQYLLPSRLSKLVESSFFLKIELNTNLHPHYRFLKGRVYGLYICLPNVRF